MLRTDFVKANDAIDGTVATLTLIATRARESYVTIREIREIRTSRLVQIGRKERDYCEAVV